MIRCDARPWVVVLAVAALSLGSARAAPSSVEKSTADALFKEGKKLMDAKDFDAACPKLQESARLQPGGGVQLALALCHEGQGRLATAWNDYREALALAKRDKRKDREDIATAKLAELEPKLAKLTITLSDPAKAQGVTVKLDDAALPTASFGVAIRVDKGTHVVVASAPGKVSKTLEVPIADKEDKTVVVPELAPEPTKPVAPTTEPPPPPGPTTPPPTPAGPSRVGPLVLGGLGVALVGVGGFFGVRALGLASDVKDHCPGGACTSSEWVGKNDEARRSAWISNVTLGVGLAAVVGATVWWVTTPSEKPVTVGIGPGEVRMVVRW